MYWLCNINF